MSGSGATDIREQILSRLQTVLEGIEGIETVTRNRGDIPADKRPAIELWDADEEADPDAFHKGRKPYGPNIVVMSPQIVLVLKTIDPATIGPEINALRLSVIKAVLTDTELKTLTGSNGDIRYLHALSDLGRGMTMKGEMAFGFAFAYVLQPLRL